MRGLVVISPHLDDAVFSCGTLIATVALFGQVTVASVCSLDRTRCREDERALDILGAYPLHLDVAEGADLGEIEAALAPAFAAGDRFIGPLGVRHQDHKRVAEACEGRVHYRYEELPYRVLWPEFMPHPSPVPVLELPSSAIKQAAVACYESQLGGTAGEALWAGERYHREG